MKKVGNKFLFVGVIIIVILLIMVIKMKIENKEPDVNQMTEDEVKAYMQEQTEILNKKELSEKGERDRMEHYVSEFIMAVENNEYEEAYDMLYSEFKANLFPSLEKFEEFAKEKFPKFASIEFVNIERNGDIYVIWIKMSDSLGSKGSYKGMNFVVREKDLDDFELSFSADI